MKFKTVTGYKAAIGAMWLVSGTAAVVLIVKHGGWWLMAGIFLWTVCTNLERKLND